MNLQMTAERERRAVVARADGEREAQIKRAEGEKAALVLAAEGRKAAAIQDAEARERLAGAEATATRLVAEQASSAGEAALRYFIADRYTRAVQSIASAPNARVIVVPMESAGLAGGIAQALEFLRGGDSPPARPLPVSPLPAQLTPVPQPAPQQAPGVTNQEPPPPR
jgi:regulator of protease activity HflC (stomatin/prohibitin superfamily)